MPSSVRELRAPEGGAWLEPEDGELAPTRRHALPLPRLLVGLVAAARLFVSLVVAGHLKRSCTLSALMFWWVVEVRAEAPTLPHRIIALALASCSPPPAASALVSSTSCGCLAASRSGALLHVLRLIAWSNGSCPRKLEKKMWTTFPYGNIEKKKKESIREGTGRKRAGIRASRRSGQWRWRWCKALSGTSRP